MDVRERSQRKPPILLHFVSGTDLQQNGQFESEHADLSLSARHRVESLVRHFPGYHLTSCISLQWTPVNYISRSHNPGSSLDSYCQTHFLSKREMCGNAVLHKWSKTVADTSGPSWKTCLSSHCRLKHSLLFWCGPFSSVPYDLEENERWEL